MNRYRFALASVLRARTAQEDIAGQRLSAANLEVQAARARYAAQLAESHNRAQAAGPVDLVDFQADRAAEERMAASLDRARQGVAMAEVAAASCYAAWVECAKRVASLERLEERHRAEWGAEALRHEAAMVDDVVASRWIASSDKTPGSAR